MVKLNYQISETTPLDTKIIIDRVLLKLQQKKYGIISIAENKVIFDHYSGGVVGNWEYYDRLDSGKFEVIVEGKYNIVNFEYCPIPLSEYIFVLVASGIFIIVGIINYTIFAAFPAILFSGTLISKYFNLKRIADKMLAEILNKVDK